MFCLLIFLVYKYPEKRQAGGEEFFVRFAVVFALLCSFTAACTADGEEPALSASFGNHEAFSNEIHGGFAVLHLLKIRFKNVAQQVFVRAVKIAGINVSVCFAYKLVRAMPFDSALFRGLTEEKPHPVVKLAYADVLVPHVVFYVKVKQLDQKISILLGCHIKLAFFR